MTKQITRRNHYNPCFWTAFWNHEYYINSLNNSNEVLQPREQIVYVLNVKSNSIYTSKVENVHFDKNFGIAEITFESAKIFCKRHHPEKYEEFCLNKNNDPYPIYINFEDILTAFENNIGYQVLLSIIKRRDIASIAEKSFLATFIHFQFLRSHAIINTALEWNANIGIEKFEYFVLLKWALSNPNFYLHAISRLSLSQWILYKTNEDKFPLTDSPILVNTESVMVALSPRLLLEVSLKTPAKKSGWVVRNNIDQNTLNEFQTRTINNTFREIIFSNGNLLEKWKKTSMFQKRVKTTNKMKEYRELVINKTNKEAWFMDGIGITENYSK